MVVYVVVYGKVCWALKPALRAFPGVQLGGGLTAHVSRGALKLVEHILDVHGGERPPPPTDGLTA